MTLPLEPDAMARLGIRHVLLDWTPPADVAAPGWLGPTAADSTFGVFENPAWLGEAVAWPAAEIVSSDRGAAELLREEGDRLSNTALVDDPDPPGVLFATRTIGSEPTVAVVGTRRCTSYGRRVAGELGRRLAQAGVRVVSGVAVGVDGAAQRAAGTGQPSSLWGRPPRVYPVSLTFCGSGVKKETAPNRRRRESVSIKPESPSLVDGIGKLNRVLGFHENPPLGRGRPG